MPIADVVIVGGGPAGLAVAIDTAQRGLSTVVLERRALPVDKACGEGIMPPGVSALEALGVCQLINTNEYAPIEGIRYFQEDGSYAEGRLPGRGGLGVRRVALVEAFIRKACQVGVEIRENQTVRSFSRHPDKVCIETETGLISGRMLVAADGLASPMRHAAGLDIPLQAPRRFGLRQHFSLRPWSPFVEVYLSDTAEAYVTPAGAHRVGVAFLWEPERLCQAACISSFLEQFPVLRERLQGAPVDSKPLGAGPFARTARSCIADRFALVGDAAGYMDAITGEGLSLAFACAAALSRVLPHALMRGATKRSLTPYAHIFTHEFRQYSLIAKATLALARRPTLRRRVVHGLSAHPKIFDTLLTLLSK